MHNKNIVVIGGSHGIGAQIVHRCLARGASLTVVSRTRGELPVGDQLTHIEADVLSGDLTGEMFPAAIHGWVYCPGSINLGPIRSLSPQTMRDDFELNVVGAAQCLQLVLKALKAASQASVVLFSTVAVQHGFTMHTSVAAAKGAIEALTRTWAAELAPAVRVNCIAPALTDTPLSEKLLASEERRQAMAKMYPLGRYGQANDIAAAAEFLLSDASSWMTAQVLGVDGGLARLPK